MVHYEVRARLAQRAAQGMLAAQRQRGLFDTSKGGTDVD
jgi:hypothetical protein